MKFVKYVAVLLGMTMLLYACGFSQGEDTAAPENSSAGQDETEREDEAKSGIAYESAADADVDFAALKEENEEIFGWLYIPDTDIDYPILQSAEADDYYETHNASRDSDDDGALYIEAANLNTMCDFNTVIHGKTDADGKDGLFADLYQFADPAFFDSHEQIYLYRDGNVLTYEVFAAFERENTSLIRTYDFTYLTGCQQFLDDLYGTRDMTMQIRDGWEGITPYHFLITLTTSQGENADKQYVVIAALVADAAGTIDRVAFE